METKSKWKMVEMDEAFKLVDKVCKEIPLKEKLVGVEQALG